MESIAADLGGNTDTLSYAGSIAGVVVNLATGAASGFTSIANISNLTGTAQADTLTGSAAANTLNGGGAGDTLIGGGGADTIDTGAANDDLVDVIRFAATTDFGDTVTNFDATGTAAQVDLVQFSGALNTAFDDITNDDNITFAVGNGAAGAVTVNLNTAIEALLLTGAGGEGVTTAQLGNATAVSTAFNNEFTMTAANGQDALLVVNDTNGNSYAVWQWIQAGGGETSAAELTLIGIFSGNGTVTTSSFDFFLVMGARKPGAEAAHTRIWG